MLAMLDTQLGRADGLPLDVEWMSIKTGFDRRLLQLIRQKGPFSQWRTLKVISLEMGLDRDRAFTLDSYDVFSNLESLTIRIFISNKILEIIDRTTTSKLQFLEVQCDRTTQEVLDTNYRRMMQHIRCLNIYSIKVTSTPSNVLEVQAIVRTTHYFPHIKKYSLIRCEFTCGQPYDLKNLTCFTVTHMIILNNDVKVHLPVLRRLEFGALIARDRTKIDAPVLETLRLLSIKGHNRKFQDKITRLNLDSYVLSPTKSIIIGVYPPHTAILFLEQSPRVTQVSLSFEDAVSAERMLERMEGGNHADDPEDSARAGRLCEDMEELRINLGYEICDLEAWKRRASQLVERRRTLGLELRMYASWRGEGTYVLLA
jgi:hypothetical protein